MRITPTSHPHIYGAFLAIDYDSGMPSAHPEHYDVPGLWDEELPAIEASLAKLSANDLETLTIGDVSDQEEMVKATPELDRASALFAGFFSDWQ